MRLILYVVITVKIPVLGLRGLQYYDKRQSGTPGSFTFHIAVTKIKDSTTASGICVNHDFKSQMQFTFSWSIFTYANCIVVMLDFRGGIIWVMNNWLYIMHYLPVAFQCGYGIISSIIKIIRCKMPYLCIYMYMHNMNQSLSWCITMHTSCHIYTYICAINEILLYSHIYWNIYIHLIKYLHTRKSFIYV